MRLGIGQSAVSRRVQNLEDPLGVSFFERSSVGIRLTNAGWMFLGRIRRILGEFHLATENIESTGIGKCVEINIGLTGALSSGPFLDVVSSFLQTHPKVRARFTEGEKSELETLLRHRILDLIYVTGRPLPCRVDGLLFAKHPIRLTIAQQDRLAVRKSVSWEEVANKKLLIKPLMDQINRAFREE